MQFSIQKCRFENVNMALLCKKLATGPRSNQVDIIQCGQILNTCTTLAAFWPKLNAISKKIFNLKSFFMLFNWQKDYFKPNSNTKHDLDSKYNAFNPPEKTNFLHTFSVLGKVFSNHSVTLKPFLGGELAKINLNCAAYWLNLALQLGRFWTLPSQFWLKRVKNNPFIGT